MHTHIMQRHKENVLTSSLLDASCAHSSSGVRPNWENIYRKLLPKPVILIKLLNIQSVLDWQHTKNNKPSMVDSALSAPVTALEALSDHPLCLIIIIIKDYGIGQNPLQCSQCNQVKNQQCTLDHACDLHLTKTLFFQTKI